MAHWLFAVHVALHVRSGEGGGPDETVMTEVPLLTAFPAIITFAVIVDVPNPSPVATVVYGAVVSLTLLKLTSAGLLVVNVTLETVPFWTFVTVAVRSTVPPFAIVALAGIKLMSAEGVTEPQVQSVSPEHEGFLHLSAAPAMT